MEEMRATFQLKKCKGRAICNHNDRSFDISKADNIDPDYKQVDKSYIFKDNENHTMMRVGLGKGKLAIHESEYYKTRYKDHYAAQREKYEKKSQYAYAKKCTPTNAWENQTTCPTSFIWQVGDKYKYRNEENFEKMVLNDIAHLEKTYTNENARIKFLDVSFHLSERKGSMHAHGRAVLEVKDKDGNWYPYQEGFLKEMGFEVPNKEKDKSKAQNGSRYNNRLQVFTAKEMDKWYDIVEEIEKGNIKVNREPKPNLNNASKVEKAITEFSRLKELCEKIPNMLNQFKREIKGLSKEAIKEKEKACMDTIESLEKEFNKLSKKYGIESEDDLKNFENDLREEANAYSLPMEDDDFDFDL